MLMTKQMTVRMMMTDMDIRPEEVDDDDENDDNSDDDDEADEDDNDRQIGDTRSEDYGDGFLRPQIVFTILRIIVDENGAGDRHVHDALVVLGRQQH